MTRTLRTGCVIALAALLLGCGGVGKRPFLLLDICVKDAQGVQDFRNELAAIAQTENMTMGERSADAARELVALKQTESSRVNRAVPLLVVRLSRDDGVSLSAGNLGLADYQIAIGFQDGSPVSRELAERVVARFEQRWPVKRIDGERYGVMPNADCS